MDSIRAIDGSVQGGMDTLVKRTREWVILKTCDLTYLGSSSATSPTTSTSTQQHLQRDATPMGTGSRRSSDASDRSQGTERPGMARAQTSPAMAWWR